LSKDEEKKLLDNSPEWTKQIIIFSLNTGLRLGELTGLEWSRVNIFNKTILIDNSKNGEQRTIPLNKYALDVVKQRLRVKSLKYDYVFINRYSWKINPNSLRDAFRKILRKVEITDFRLHDLRHSFATRLTQADVDLYKISKLLGHKDIKMTQRYAHHCPNSLKPALEVLESDYVLTAVNSSPSPHPPKYRNALTNVYWSYIRLACKT
jgi:integrase|tara:strand:- start:102 stop:725 length:624 start_codon:yes stop_codon:yes gene_type:complete